jgi:hypothetical protein
MLNAGKIVGTIQTKAHMTNLSKVAERQSQWARLLYQNILRTLVRFTHPDGESRGIKDENQRKPTKMD